MEMKGLIRHIMRSFGICLVTILLLGAGQHVCSQPPSKVYTVKNGKMYIQLSRGMPESSLDSFISQFSLENLALKKFLANGFDDSLIKFGWQIEVMNTASCVITKPLAALDNLDNPAEHIRITEEQAAWRAKFPSVSNKTVMGYNRFRNKYPFTSGSAGTTFFLRGHREAKRVILAGSFNDWNPASLAMTLTDSGWIANVPLTPGKYWYKFIVNGNWIIDEDNRLNENDGRGNTNSVFYVANARFRLEGFTNARNVFISGSFNKWDEKQLAMNRVANGWELPLYLADGTHTYRFIVDGKWVTDPANADRFPNEFNDFNSVIRIGSPSVFRLNGYPEAKNVILTGSFNNWRKDELFMKKVPTGWELEYTLGPGNHEYKVIADGKELPNTQGRLTVDNEKNEQSLLVLYANYTFRLKGYPNARSVFLAGEFNDWNPATMPMQKEGDEWIYRVYLSPGKHLYKFIVNGKWIIDPANSSWEQNEFGTGNSVLWIGQ